MARAERPVALRAADAEASRCRRADAAAAGGRCGIPDGDGIAGMHAADTAHLQTCRSWRSHDIGAGAKQHAAVPLSTAYTMLTDFPSGRALCRWSNQAACNGAAVVCSSLRTVAIRRAEEQAIAAGSKKSLPVLHGLVETDPDLSDVESRASHFLHNHLAALRVPLLSFNLCALN